MMGNKKTELKWFTIPQYREEEEYLTSMHGKGWEFKGVSFPGFYHFEECEPQNVVYRLDYNPDGTKNKDEYVRMFADCGWEYMLDFVGYSYFRKPCGADDRNDEIFCDDDSRLDMMRRVFRGRVFPLIAIFFCAIIPQFFRNSSGYGGSVFGEIFSIIFFALGLLYVVLFASFAVQFYRYEKSLDRENEKLKTKYFGVFAGLVICTLLLAGGMYFSFMSDYSVNDSGSGFSIDAGRLNTSVERSFELCAGDKIEVSHFSDGGSVYIEIAKEGDSPVFTGNTYEEFDDFAVEIQEDGAYTIKCSGKRAKGILDFKIVRGGSE